MPTPKMYIHIDYIEPICYKTGIYYTKCSCNCVIHITDMYLAIQVQHDTVVYLTLNVHPKGENTALIVYYIVLIRRASIRA
jgi:hypothetical protein